jgi:hypothetical protein
MATPAPETSWWLVTVDPDVAEMLAVVALSKVSVEFVGSHFNADIKKVGDRKD